ncbi:MAG: 2Fe-2S iron-sulfur cluster-binding protein [Actinomycetota bacterium]
MASIRFEGREVDFVGGDTVASALYRDGVRTFSRSPKYHRRRGLYCGTGDCPNCLITVDGQPATRSCQSSCRDGMTVAREGGWPSTEHDLLHVTDSLHRLMPVGFYYKTFIRPRFAWQVAEKVIRRATGLGTLPQTRRAERKVVRNGRCDVLVVGAGSAGLEAARDAASAGERVLLCDESTIGSTIAPGPSLDHVRTLEAEVRALRHVTVLEGHAAIGIYEGIEVPLVAEDELVRVHPGRVVVATGATEIHPVFPGNDLPGIWLGRGAARMAGVHGVRPGDVAVVAAATEEAIEHLATLRAAGVRVVAVAVPAALADRVPGGVGEIVIDGVVHEARGDETLRSVVLRRGTHRRRFACDTLVMSLGLAPRDALARMSLPGEPVELVGDAAGADATPSNGDDGTVCLCEDVSLHDLEQAWDEGFRSAEILKRYTTTTMGPCQGAMCGRALSCFVRDRVAASADGPTPAGPAEDGLPRVAARTTARPPARAVTLETLAAGVHELYDKRTSLHDVHLAAGARMDRSGGWLRPLTYGDWREEYRAVRERVSVMDVGTLGKFTVAGPDAATLIDRIFPCRTDDLVAGGTRYVLSLDEAGYVMDDGLLCALGDGTFYLNSTSGGAGRTDKRLRDLADRMGLEVHVLDRTAQWGAINVAGPYARDLLARLTDDPIDAETLPYPGHAGITVAGVPCRAIRTGFVGELAFELHHPRSRGPELWGTLVREGAAWDLRPHGLDALELLRLEKGHIYLGQDTLPDDTPAKLRMAWAVAMDKEWFVGKRALERIAELPLSRTSVGLEFDRPPENAAELRGAPLLVGGHVVGRITSAERSIVLDRAIGLGWIRASSEGGFPTALDVAGDGDVRARAVPTPFYDPAGERLRG